MRIINFGLITLLLADLCTAFTYNLLMNKPNNKLFLNYKMNLDNIDDNIPYLNRLENVPVKSNIDKLKSIQNNINKYIDEKKNVNEPKYISCYNNPIKKATFDKIFLNIQNIQTIYISNDCDRAIFVFLNAQRLVYYIHNKDEYKLIEKIINIASQSLQKFKVIVICNKDLMTDKFGFLYCDKD